MKIAQGGEPNLYFVETKLGLKEREDEDVRAVEAAAKIDLTHINQLRKPPKKIES